MRSNETVWTVLSLQGWVEARSIFGPRERPIMFLILAVVLVVLWLGGFTLMHVSSLAIHLLLVFAVISIVMHFISGRRAT